jgi:two-component system, NarL family, response regulator DevR
MEVVMIAISEQTAEQGADRASGSGVGAARKRLLVVDDHSAVRRGLRSLLQDQPDFAVVDVVATAEAAVSIAERTAIDVAVVDYQLGGRSGLWVSRRLKRLPRPPKVLLYSAYSDGLLAAACVVAEADGLIAKSGVGLEVCASIRIVASGRLLLPIVPQPLAGMVRDRLEEEEQAIFSLLLAGLTPSTVGRSLGISSEHLEARLSKMLGKLESLQVDPAIPTGARASIGGRRPMRRRDLHERSGW